MTNSNNDDEFVCADCYVAESLWNDRFDEVEWLAEDILNPQYGFITRSDFVSRVEYLLYLTRSPSERLHESNDGGGCGEK